MGTPTPGRAMWCSAQRRWADQMMRPSRLTMSSPPQRPRMSSTCLSDNGFGIDFDPDLDSLEISAINGTPVAIGDQVTLPAGLTLEIDLGGESDCDRSRINRAWARDLDNLYLRSDRWPWRSVKRICADHLPGRCNQALGSRRDQRLPPRRDRRAPTSERRVPSPVRGM